MKNLDSSLIGNATKNLARKFNTQMSRVRETRNLPEDDLAVTEADVRVLCHVGFPENADSVAYESNQRLLAVRWFDRFGLGFWVTVNQCLD